MSEKIVSAIVLSLLLIGTLTSAFEVQSVKAEDGTITIRADGSIDPPTAPIITSDYVTYTFVGNIQDQITIERSNITIDGNGYTLLGNASGTGLYWNGIDNVTIQNTNIIDSVWGIGLNSSSGNSVIGNNITNNGYCGIWFNSSSNNKVNGNNIAVNGRGIEFWSSSNNNSVSGNTMTDNTYSGIYLDSSSGNSVSGNNITSNRYNTDGIVLWFSSSNSVSRNTIINMYHGGGILLGYSSGNSVSGNSLTNNLDGLDFLFSSSNSVSGNNIANIDYGMRLSYVCDNDFSGNTITNNTYGIVLSSSSYNNNFSENSITNNSIYGLDIFSSSNNSIYHNNFVDNTQQVVSDSSMNLWDGGYPSGGNYWSDYNGSDLHSGPYQNVTGSDGMGDVAYVINGNNQDNYPLMKLCPWAAHDVGTTSVATSKSFVGQGYNASINVMMFNYGNETENINVTICANQTAISEIYNVELTSRNFAIIPFTWNTTGFAYGNYTISAYAWPVLGETDTSDNNFTLGVVKVTIPGDINGDFKCALADLSLLAKAFNTYPGDAKWNPNADLNGDGRVSLADLSVMAKYFNQHC